MKEKNKSAEEIRRKRRDWRLSKRNELTEWQKINLKRGVLKGEKVLGN